MEAVPEDPDLKAQILRRASTAEAAIIATNTSSLPIAGLADAVDGARALPRRALVQPAGVDAGHRGDRRPGHRPRDGRADARPSCAPSASSPAEVADRAGFVSNRLQMALLREALAIVAEGQTTREDLDVIVRSTFGFRLPFYGPFQIADMAGLDTYVSVYETLERDVGPEFAPPGGAARARRRRPARGQERRGLRDVLRRRARQAPARARPPLRRAVEAARGNRRFTRTRRTGLTFARHVPPGKQSVRENLHAAGRGAPMTDSATVTREDAGKEVPVKQARDREHDRDHHRGLRLRPLRDGRRARLRQALLPRRRSGHRHAGGVRDVRRRLPRPPRRRRDLRPLRRQGRAQEDARARARDHGRRHRADRRAARAMTRSASGPRSCSSRCA